MLFFFFFLSIFPKVKEAYINSQAIWMRASSVSSQEHPLEHWLRTLIWLPGQSAFHYNPSLYLFTMISNPFIKDLLTLILVRLNDSGFSSSTVCFIFSLLPTPFSINEMLPSTYIETSGLLCIWLPKSCWSGVCIQLLCSWIMQVIILETCFPPPLSHLWLKGCRSYCCGSPFLIKAETYIPGRSLFCCSILVELFSPSRFSAPTTLCPVGTQVRKGAAGESTQSCVLTLSWCISDGCVGKRQASRNAADKIQKEVVWAVTEVAGA